MKHIKSERGQSLVELAISIVILIYLLSGAVEFGLAFFQFVQLRDAAQEGALFGSINPTQLTFIENRARGASSSPVNLDISASNPVKVQIYIDNILVQENLVPTGATVSSCEGHGLEVRVSYNHKIFTS